MFPVKIFIKCRFEYDRLKMQNINMLNLLKESAGMTSANGALLVSSLEECFKAVNYPEDPGFDS